MEIHFPNKRQYTLVSTSTSEFVLLFCGLTHPRAAENDVF
jgi:hypothetical protein